MAKMHGDALQMVDAKINKVEKDLAQARAHLETHEQNAGTQRTLISLLDDQARRLKQSKILLEQADSNDSA